MLFGGTLQPTWFAKPGGFLQSGFDLVWGDVLRSLWRENDRERSRTAETQVFTSEKAAKIGVTKTVSCFAVGKRGVLGQQVFLRICWGFGVEQQ